MNFAIKLLFNATWKVDLEKWKIPTKEYIEFDWLANVTYPHMFGYFKNKKQEKKQKQKTKYKNKSKLSGRSIKKYIILRVIWCKQVKVDEEKKNVVYSMKHTRGNISFIEYMAV